MIATDIEDDKLKLAKEMGADIIVNTRNQDLKEVSAMESLLFLVVVLVLVVVLLLLFLLFLLFRLYLWSSQFLVRIL